MSARCWRSECFRGCYYPEVCSETPRTQEAVPPQPEEAATGTVRDVDLTQAASWLTVLRNDPELTREYRGALGMWVEMLSAASDEDALAYAETLMAAKDLHPTRPVRAYTTPF